MSPALAAGPTYGDTFPDPNFRAHVLDLLKAGGISRTDTSEVVAADKTFLSRVTTLELGTVDNPANKPMSTLKGIELFTGLVSLTCEDIGLKELSVTANTKLDVLACGYNELTTLDVSKNTGLSDLNCAANALTTLNVTKNTGLNTLYVENYIDLETGEVRGNNRLTSIDVTKNTWLYVLAIGGNQLTSIDVSKNIFLIALGVNENKLTTLNVANNTGLRLIAANGNQLSSIDVTKHTSLEFLSVNQNKLTALNVTKNTKLGYLVCFDNKITTLDVTKNTLLEYLLCADNQLTTLDVTKNTILMTLDARMNKMKTETDVKGWSTNSQLILGESFMFRPQIGDPPDLSAIEIATPPVKTSYVAGETLNLSGLTVRASYVDGSTQLISDFTAAPANGAVLTTANNKVTITYQGKTAELPITVTEPVLLTGIEIVNPPAKTSYVAGEALNLAGLTVRANYSDGSNQMITGYSAAPSNGTILTTANGKVTVTYQSKTAEIPITVTARPVILTDIAVAQMPAKTVYTVGEPLDLSWLVVKAIYDDGSENIISDYVASPAQGTVLTLIGDHKVTLSWQGKTAEFAISVHPAPVILSGIEIVTNPVKTRYVAGETLDLSGLTVRATYSDGSNQMVSGFTTTPAGGAALTTADDRVTVTYQGKTAEFPITVEPRIVNLTDIAVAQMPSKTVYTVGEPLDLSWLVVKAIYDDGSENIVSDYMASPAQGTVLALTDNKVTLSWQGKTAEFAITVNPAPVVLSDIEIVTNPAKTRYVAGETLDLSGLTVRATYSDGSNQMVSGFTTAPAGGAALTTANDKVTVTYQGKTAEFPITVEPRVVNLTGIAVAQMPSKTVYTVGEALDLSWLVVKAIYDDGSENIVSDYMASPAQGTVLALTDNKVTLSWQGKTAEFAITVNPAPVVLSGIEIVTNPAKTRYVAGETLDLSGLTVRATYSDGSNQMVSGFTTAPAGGAALTTANDKVTVTYQGRTAEFPITVEPAPLTLTGIEIGTPPAKTSYLDGETLNLTGLTVRGRFSDGSTQTMVGYTTDPANGATLTTANKKVTVALLDKTAEFPISVTTPPVGDPLLTITNTAGGGVIRLPLFTSNPKAGTAITVYAFPQSGYKLARWEMTGMTAPTPPTNPLTFTMPANDVAVNAVFEPLDELYTITVQTEGLGVVLGAPATAYAGTTVNMLALPLWPIASVDHWEVNGVNIGKTLVHSFVVAGNTTVKVVFK